MAKNKETKDAAKSKKRTLDDIRKKNLKVVLYKNKYFHNETRSKQDLINRLLFEKKKVLKLQSTDNDLNSEDENNIYEDEVLKVLKQEKQNIFGNKSSDPIDLNELAPVEILEANKRWKEEQKEKVILPAIPRKEIDALLSTLSTDKSFSRYENNLNECLAHLHSSAKPFWNSPSCIMKAIKDCILRRKWNNLTHLVLMLIHLPSLKSKPFIRHLCLVLNKLHPTIGRSSLQNQLSMVYEANKGNHH